MEQTNDNKNSAKDRPGPSRSNSVQKSRFPSVLANASRCNKVKLLLSQLFPFVPCCIWQDSSGIEKSA